MCAPLLLIVAGYAHNTDLCTAARHIPRGNREMNTYNGNDAQISTFWNERFGQDAYVYGKEPNEYFRSVIDKLPPGRLFVPGAGEGRDAVYAATLGWEVHCLDLSAEGRRKAMLLAAERGVSIHYDVQSITEAAFPDGYFNMVASVFFHLPTAIRHRFYADAHRWLGPGGIFLMEAFTPAQLANNSGGPKDPDMLVDAATVRTDLAQFHILRVAEEEPMLAEGSHHTGKAHVVDVLALR
jgi:SAM-dependent methyltransferase